MKQHNKLKHHNKLWMSIKKNLSILKNKRFHVKKIAKLEYLIDMRNRIDRRLDAFSEYEQAQIDFFFTRLKVNNCEYFIDIGAHWGHYSMLFASEPCFNQAEIHAFEPDKINRYQFYANLFLNKLHDRITVYDFALSNAEDKLKFHHHHESNRGKSSISNDGELVVTAKKLDSLIKLSDKVIGVKIDVEGHELDVISGMTNLLRNNNCILQIESFPESIPDLKSKMLKLGYKSKHNIGSDYYFSRQN